MQTEINSELNQVKLWAKLNKLSLNTNKMTLMVFHRKQKQLKIINISNDNIQIERVHSFNFLGILLDETLSWKNHPIMIVNKVSRVTGILYSLKNIFPKEILLTLYNSLIGSYINYGLLIWGKESHMIDTLQKEAIRQVTNSTYKTHTTPLFKRVGVLKVQDMFKLRLLNLCYKLYYGLLPQYFNCYHDVIEKQPPRVLRQHIIHQSMIKQVYAECSPLFKLIKLKIDLLKCI